MGTDKFPDLRVSLRRPRFGLAGVRDEGTTRGGQAQWKPRESASCT
jgi:hypothetical protein